MVAVATTPMGWRYVSMVVLVLELPFDLQLYSALVCSETKFFLLGGYEICIYCVD
jgi:hypothetical protein